MSQHAAISPSTRFLHVRNQTELLCKPLNAEDYVVQPIIDVSPPKWHLAHTTWFFENFVLVPNIPGYQIFDKDFNYLFNSYYETVGERVLRPNRGLVTRPVVEKIYAYRKYVNEHIQEFLDTGSPSAEILGVLELGIQHEQQHQELLMYDIKYILGTNPIFPVYLDEDVKKVQTTYTSANYIQVEEGVYKVGYQGGGFCFDNEQGRHKVYIHPFEFMDRLVTNVEFLEFMDDGGYHDFRFWLAEGWDWVNRESIKSPFYWYNKKDSWYQYELKGGLLSVDLNKPVTHINYYEADAYARWKGKRLLTEFEWEVAYGRQNSNLNETNFAESGNFGVVAKLNDNNQMLGDAWEWTSSAYGPYPNYKIAEGALGEYNGKFMVNQMVLRGGSSATPMSHIRPTYRNFFHPHLRWLFSGIRLGSSLS